MLYLVHIRVEQGKTEMQDIAQLNGVGTRADSVLDLPSNGGKTLAFPSNGGGGKYFYMFHIKIGCKPNSSTFLENKN